MGPRVADVCHVTSFSFVIYRELGSPRLCDCVGRLSGGSASFDVTGNRSVEREPSVVIDASVPRAASQCQSRRAMGAPRSRGR